MTELIKIEPDKECPSCGNTPGIAVSFFNGLPQVCHCIMKKITVDGKQSLYDFVEEHTEKR